MKAVFSILHTSARPDKWRAVYDDWMSKAVWPELVEYVLCIDPRWGFSLDPAEYDTQLDNIRLVVNDRRRCYVDGVNIAAEASEGSILCVNADDQFACEGWDSFILNTVRTQLGRAASGDVDSFVVSICTGTPQERERAIMVAPVLSRARYQHQGFVFYPEYESMCADNDFCESAVKDGVVIDAFDVGHTFPHRHPMFDETGWLYKDWVNILDEQYLTQNSPTSRDLGLAVLARRRLSGFPPMARSIARSIALCLSGERFEGVWVDHMLDLQAHLIRSGFNIMRIRPSTKTNVYVTREDLRRAVVNSEFNPELCLWLDDDNPLSIANFDRLLAGLDQNPDVDGVAGWCWIHDEKKTRFMPSCGNWAPDHLHWIAFPPTFANEQALRPFETGGLPCLLMRTSAFVKAGDGAFLPVLDSRLEHGMTGEDLSFFLHAEQGGCKFLVDPGARLPHLKYVEVEPVFPSEGRASVKVAGMLRVKNEGRWIRRAVESLKELCGSDIYVMEDGSTDDTRVEAQAAGAHVLDSPFAHLGLNEVRDKNWLVGEVKSRCNPDWIIMIDGDEELEPGAGEKIRRELERNPPVDCYCVKFLYLWDSVESVRLDGVYGKMQRQSVFRVGSDLEFKSYYTGDNENHVGLHCSNAPGLGGLRIASLNVFLLHYGYLHREDRLNKYAWILSIDPRNEAEDFYRHTVQGDIEEVPAGAVLKHAGPLKLGALPARLVPKFEVVPGPRETRVLQYGD